MAVKEVASTLDTAGGSVFIEEVDRLIINGGSQRIHLLWIGGPPTGCSVYRWLRKIDSTTSG